MNSLVVYIIVFITLISFNAIHAQNVIFTQWENASSYTNPALTGNFNGSFRILSKFRQQFISFLEQDSYRTGFLSAEYKFEPNSNRRLHLGFYSLLDKAGEAEFTTSSQSISASLVQELVDLNRTYHEFSLGVRTGFNVNSINPEALRWPGGMAPDIDSHRSYGDIAVGANWKLTTNKKLSFQLGSELHHINLPNISPLPNISNSGYIRFNLHGKLEIPLSNKLTIISYQRS